MGSVIASTVKARDAFPDKFEKNDWWGDIQIKDPELVKRFSGPFEDKKLGGLFTPVLIKEDNNLLELNTMFGDAINLNPHKLKNIQRSLKHETTHKVVSAPFTFSTDTPLQKGIDSNKSAIQQYSDITDIWGDDRTREIANVLEKENPPALRRPEYAIRKFLHNYDKEKRGEEALALQGSIFPESLYENPIEPYEKEFYKQFKLPETQKRLFKPTSVEYIL